MTTLASERLYEAQRLMKMKGKGVAIYNPLNKPINTLPVIYGFNNGGSSRLYSACLIASDRHFLGSHLCSSEAYMPHDLGILEDTRPDRHESFRKHFPDGYRMEFVFGNPRGHKGLMTAYKLNQELGKNTKKEEKREGEKK